MGRENIINQASIEIYKDEGFKNFVYDDTEKIPTEGIGFKVSALSDLERQILEKGITLENSLKVLGMKLDRVYNELSNGINFFTVLPDNCQIALLDLAYQVGSEGVMAYHKCLSALEQKDYLEAGLEIIHSKEAVQTPNRAKHIQKLILGEI